mmetsp:Transcript_51644/g.129588  ORF Transcript_51644/g.129588 Transcript_51644/m.129588 type:complete len:261 (-) Transcript_51644:748-1530(-)
MIVGSSSRGFTFSASSPRRRSTCGAVVCRASKVGCSTATSSRVRYGERKRCMRLTMTSSEESTLCSSSTRSVSLANWSSGPPSATVADAAVSAFAEPTCLLLAAPPVASSSAITRGMKRGSSGRTRGPSSAQCVARQMSALASTTCSRSRSSALTSTGSVLCTKRSACSAAKLRARISMVSSETCRLAAGSNARPVAISSSSASSASSSSSSLLSSVSGTVLPLATTLVSTGSRSSTSDTCRSTMCARCLSSLSLSRASA